VNRLASTCAALRIPDLAGALALLAICAPAGAQTVTEAGAAGPSPSALAAFARGHAAWSHRRTGLVLEGATALGDAVDALRAAPTAATLAAARAAWCAARRAYGRIEVMRFQGGPIEPLEPCLNSWPVDEAYLDRTVDGKATGIVQNVRDFPQPSAALLRLANERGGEANICLGWHAAEFLLWGQDLSTSGPGDRRPTDFDAAHDPFAARRGECLRTITAVLVDDLRTLHAAWAPAADNHRRGFESAGRDALRDALTGAVVLSAFELGGERLTVAHETRDQEQEHSCFSDTTCADLEANQLGIVDVCLGDRDTGHPGVASLLGPRAQDLAALLRARLQATTNALRAIPQPFDQAILGPDDAPGRRAIAAAIVALEEQTEVLLLVGAEFGFDLPLRPGA
jgi:putative iron-regulated protein